MCKPMTIESPQCEKNLKMPIVAKTSSMFVCFNRTKFPNITRAINITPGRAGMGVD
jgi:hypothetical protein